MFKLVLSKRGKFLKPALVNAAKNVPRIDFRFWYDLWKETGVNLLTKIMGFCNLNCQCVFVLSIYDILNALFLLVDDDIVLLLRALQLELAFTCDHPFDTDATVISIDNVCKIEMLHTRLDTYCITTDGHIIHFEF